MNKKNILTRSFLSFFLAALLSVAIWFQFTYPQLSFIDLSVSRDKAYKIAEQYLRLERGVDTKTYRHATIFSDADGADRYLQKSIGFKKEIEFLKEHKLEFFAWSVRFFREDEKEQYYVGVSAGTGEILGFSHSIKDTEARPFVEKETAKQTGIDFLRKRFGFDPSLYTIQGDSNSKLDNRMEYSFSWEKNGVYMPWSPEPETGGGKLVTSVSVSGNEIMSFSKNGLQIPEEFNRYMARQQNTGRNLALLFRIVYFALLVSAVFFVMVRRNNLVMHAVKRFCIGLTFFLFLLNIFSYFNDFEGVLYNYPTTSSFNSYFIRQVINLILNTFIVTIGILMPCLAGESLHYEIFPGKKEGSFLHFLRSTFFSRQVSQAILIGYFSSFIMIGIQSLAFAVGQRYWGVWVQYSWMTQLSSSYLPFFTAFVIGFSASFVEEISFRIFSISLGKKIFKHTLIAVFLAALIWGYGHSTYLVFPMWFRGLEVTCLGLFLSYIYLRYGIIPVIVAHFIFDVFWSSSGYLFGKASPFNFYTSLGVLLIPFIWGLAAYILNKLVVERPLRWELNQHQLYNIEVLKSYLKDKKPPGPNEQKKLQDEIVSHGWDQAVVEIVLSDLKKSA